MTPDLAYRTRLERADQYFDAALSEGRYDLLADAVRIRCRIHADQGYPEYATWRTDR